MMNVRRYRTSGTAHRKGITATSWHIRLVVARSMTEAAIGSRNQNSCADHEGEGTAGPASAVTGAGGCFIIPRAQTDELATKKRYQPHHSQAWVCSRN